MGVYAARPRSFTVRLVCGHLVTYPIHAPAVSTLAHCASCGRYRLVASHYFSRRAQCGAQTRRRMVDRIITLRCTLPPHEGGAHYDEPFGAEFSEAEVVTRLRSGTEGSAQLRA